VRRIIAAAGLAAALLLGGATAVSADPDFGPGNSSKGPNDGGAKCHTAEHGEAPSPNQEDEPGCKGN
jgi:hypothetical protein